MPPNGFKSDNVMLFNHVIALLKNIQDWKNVLIEMLKMDVKPNQRTFYKVISKDDNIQEVKEILSVAKVYSMGIKQVQ